MYEITYQKGSRTMMNTTDFTVVGEEKMHCEGCEQRVGRVLKRLPGVREVQANHRSQHVGVEYDLGQVGEESFLSQVARQVEEARALKPGILQLVDRVLAVFAPTVVGFAALAVLVWTLGAWAVTGEPNFTRAIFERGFQTNGSGWVKEPARKERAA